MTISLTDFAHENNTNQFEIAFNILQAMTRDM